MKNKGIFIAATGQNKGKTTTVLAIFRKLLDKYSKLSYMKPVGQRTIEVQGEVADEDAILMKQVFDLSNAAKALSPVTVPSGFTKNYLDGKTTNEMLIDDILGGWNELLKEEVPVIVEGTGHAGVGSIFDMNNAHVAKLLDLPVVVVAGGGIGRPLDEIALNLALFKQEGVQVKGVILNKCNPDKKDQVLEYCQKYLKKHDIPCLGVVEYNKTLSKPSLRRLLKDLNAELLSGKENLDVVPLKLLAGAGALDYILDKTWKQTVVVTPASRSDVIIAATHNFAMISEGKNTTHSEFVGIILTGDQDPHPDVLETATQSGIPILRTKEDTYEAIEIIENSLAKTLPGDTEKLDIIRNIYNEAIDWGKLIDIIEA